MEVVYVTLVCTTWFIVLFWLSYHFAPHLSKQNPPVALPLIVLAWTFITLPLLVVWVHYKAVVGQPKVSTSWFVVGWSQNLNFFNIYITKWWQYTMILMYNIGRTVLGSLISNVFRPLLLLQQSRLLKSELSRRDAFVFVFGQAVVTIFSFFSAVTDIFLFLTQIDISIIALVVTLIMDGCATYSILTPRIVHDAPAGRRGGGGRARACTSAAGSRSALEVPVLPSASAAPWRRTLPALRAGDVAEYRRLDDFEVM